MSTQCEIGFFLNISFTGIRLKLSCNIWPQTAIKSKIGGKILSQKHSKTSFIVIFQFSKTRCGLRMNG